MVWVFKISFSLQQILKSSKYYGLSPNHKITAVIQLEQPFYFPNLKKCNMTALYYIRQKDPRVLPKEIQMWLLLLIGVRSSKSLRQSEYKGDLYYFHKCWHHAQGSKVAIYQLPVSLYKQFWIKFCWNKITIKNKVAIHHRNFRAPHILQTQIFAAPRKESFYAHQKTLNSPDCGQDLLAT